MSAPESSIPSDCWQHPQPVPPASLALPVTTVARELLGKLLIRQMPSGALLVGRIVETEAYDGATDPASHSYRGRTARNGSMFLSAGHAYVYRIYGMHSMLNVVTTVSGSSSGVLIRGLEPLHGVEVMQALRGGVQADGLLRGPANVTRGLAIDGALDGHDLACAPLVLADAPSLVQPVIATKRIGLSRSLDPLCLDLDWRFYVLGSSGVSRRDKAKEAATRRSRQAC
jgi:DNA-3-methyladenine glycosylase